MRYHPFILSSVIATAILCGTAIAAPIEKPTATASPLVTEDCRKAGNEVSSLIDNRFGTPNLPAARAVFQVGVMECMEGDDIAANKHYQQARVLLGEDHQAAPNATEKR